MDFTSALTSREKQIALLLADGLSAKGIASTVHLSTRTIECHRAVTSRKIGAPSLARLIRYVIRQGRVRP